MKKLAFFLGLAIAIFVSAQIAQATQVIDDTLQVNSLKVGQQGDGGVAILNGTIANETTTGGEDNPVTFGDNVRIDGRVHRGAEAGPGDSLPFTINDDVTIGGDLTVSGAVDWSALSQYPAGCGAGQAVQSIGDALTCVSVSDSVSDHGELYVYNNTDPQTLTDQNTWYKITAFDTAGWSSNVTVSPEDDRLTVANAGMYRVEAPVSFSGTSNRTYETAVFVSGILQYRIQSTMKITTEGDVGTTMVAGTLNMNADDYVEIYMRCTSAAGASVIVKDSNLSIFAL